MNRLALLLGLCAALALGGCGKRGNPIRPAPAPGAAAPEVPPVESPDDPGPDQLDGRALDRLPGEPRID
jgi:hypothetical protein